MPLFSYDITLRRIILRKPPFPWLSPSGVIRSSSCVSEIPADSRTIEASSQRIIQPSRLPFRGKDMPGLLILSLVLSSAFSFTLVGYSVLGGRVTEVCAPLFYSPPYFFLFIESPFHVDDEISTNESFFGDVCLGGVAPHVCLLCCGDIPPKTNIFSLLILIPRVIRN